MKQKYFEKFWIKDIFFSHKKIFFFVRIEMKSHDYQTFVKKIGNYNKNNMDFFLFTYNASVKKYTSKFFSLHKTNPLYKDFLQYANTISLFNLPNKIWIKKTNFNWKKIPIIITEILLSNAIQIKPLNFFQIKIFSLKEKFRNFIHLIRLNKPIPIMHMFWTTMGSLWIASKGFPGWTLFFIFLFGIFIMRSSGSILNDIVDKKFDKNIYRTHKRPITRGSISILIAWIYLILLLSIAFGLILFTNLITIIFSFIGIILLIIYPYMKRVTNWPQFFLGISYNWGIILAFSSVLNSFPPIYAWWILCSNIFWTISYDTIYAFSDIKHDKKIGLKSTAILFDKNYHLYIYLFQIIAIINWIGIGWYLSFKWYYIIPIFFCFFLFLYQHNLLQISRVKNSIKAFNNNQWIGFIIFFSIFLYYQF